MSSLPFKLGVPVIKNLLYSFPDHFVLKSDSKEESDRKLWNLKRKLPAGATVTVKEIGFRPDHPVPVAKYFCEVIIRGRRKEWKGAKFV